MINFRAFSECVLLIFSVNSDGLIVMGLPVSTAPALPLLDSYLKQLTLQITYHAKKTVDKMEDVLVNNCYPIITTQMVIQC